MPIPCQDDDLQPVLIARGSVDVNVTIFLRSATPASAPKRYRMSPARTGVAALPEMNDLQWPLHRHNPAFGGPGAELSTSAAKDAIGTAYSTRSRIWYTIKTWNGERDLLPNH
jgi:hypothetical protein